MFLPGLVLLVCVWSPVQSACDPVEEGQSTFLTCKVNTSVCVSAIVLYWRTKTMPPAHVVSCRPNGCSGFYSSSLISATISPTSSTLTINRVSRSHPFNMETTWRCDACSITDPVTVCDKLQVYAKPSSPSCMVTGNLRSGEILSVTVTCSTHKVYPEAKCSFYTIKNGGQPVQITRTPDYETAIRTSRKPDYFSSDCAVTVSVPDLGEGTHSFQGFIYPDVTGGQSLVTGITPDKTVTLSFPRASHTCTTNTDQGYFLGKSARCTCTITSVGNPRSTAQWFRGDNPVGTIGTLDVPYDKNNAEQTYTCEAESNLGRKVGSTLIAKFAYPPDVTFTKEPKTTIFNKGGRIRLICSAQGNPDPSLTLTRERTGVVLVKVRTSSMTHTLDTLDCLDTGVYVCSGQNSWGTGYKNISINIRCPQQFSPSFDPPPIIDAVVGDSAQIDLEIYGFPEPSSLSLSTIDEKNRTSSPPHTVKYTAGDAPFGVVTVTIFDIVEADCTNYTLTIANGVEETLIYTFYLNKVKSNENEDNTEKDKGTNDTPGGDSLNIPAIIIGVTALIILATLVVIIFFLVRKNRKLKKWEVKDTDLYLAPTDSPDMGNNLHTSEIPRSGQYRNVDGVQNTTGSTPISTGLTPGSSWDKDTNDTSLTTHTAMVSASQPPETDYYETIRDIAPASGPYNSTSPQDVEPPNIYRRPIPGTSSTRHDTPSGDYNNIPRQQGEP